MQTSLDSEEIKKMKVTVVVFLGDKDMNNDPDMNNGGPAFPFYGAEGMSLRDWFAGQALVGLIAYPHSCYEGTSQQEIVQLAYGYADAMLKEGAK